MTHSPPNSKRGGMRDRARNTSSGDATATSADRCHGQKTQTTTCRGEP